MTKTQTIQAEQQERLDIESGAYQLREARSWLADCFESLPQDLTDDEVRAGVERHYYGGWQAFLEDSLLVEVTR